MAKRLFTNIYSVGFIYPRTHPSDVFIEIKDDGHPTKLVRGQLCPPGGNWIGDGALKDYGPLDTFRREINEEISFDRPIQNSLELMQMGMADMELFVPKPAPLFKPTKDDIEWLNHIKAVICESATPFGMYENIVTKAAIDKVDPENKKDGFTTLTCYWLVPLSDVDWKILGKLQRKFGNLSNESITMVTSLPEILSSRTRFAFGHDFAYRKFLLSMGISFGREIPSVYGVESSYVGQILSNYDEFLEIFDIAKKPR
jgi:hypothetical protein